MVSPVYGRMALVGDFFIGKSVDSLKNGMVHQHGMSLVETTSFVRRLAQICVASQKSTQLAIDGLVPEESPYASEPNI